MTSLFLTITTIASYSNTQPPTNWDHNIKIIIEAAKAYASKTWAKREEEPAKCLPVWVEPVRGVVIGWMHKVKKRKQYVIQSLAVLHERFVAVPTDKASNNVTIICKYLYNLVQMT